MRRAHQDRQILRDEDGKLIGVAFGYDFCAEHECGLKGFWQDFGIEGPTEKVQGVKARTITEFNEAEFFTKTFGEDTVFLWRRSFAAGYFDPNKSYKEVPGELKAFEWKGAKEDELKWGSAWSSGPGSADFGLRFRGETDVINELREAFARKDIMITAAGRKNPFGGSGLVLAIASRIPEEINKTMVEADLDNIRLQEVADATGIKRKLDKINREKGGGYQSGTGYYALSPSWANEAKTEVKFWLNPMQQHLFNAGWYTVEDLEQWIEGKGRIIKSAEERKKW